MGGRVFHLCYETSEIHLASCEGEQRFTLNFLSEEYREALNYFGRVSGYQENKFEKGLLHLDELEGFTAPIKEAHTLIECSVTFASNVEPFVLPVEIIDKFYKDHGFHTLFLGRSKRCFKDETDTSS